MILMEFWEWMNKKFIEWRGNSRGTISEFSEYVGVAQSVMSKWMGRNSKIPNSTNLSKISSKLGLEVYDVLGLPRPVSSSLGLLPPGVRTSLEAALTEINSIYAQRGISPDSPEAVSIAMQVMSKHGFIWKDNNKS